MSRFPVDRVGIVLDDGGGDASGVVRDVLAGIMRCSRNMKMDTRQFTVVGVEAYVRAGFLYLCAAARKLPEC